MYFNGSSYMNRMMKCYSSKVLLKVAWLFITELTLSPNVLDYAVSKRRAFFFLIYADVLVMLEPSLLLGIQVI